MAETTPDDSFANRVENDGIVNDRRNEDTQPLPDNTATTKAVAVSRVVEVDENSGRSEVKAATVGAGTDDQEASDHSSIVFLDDKSVSPSVTTNGPSQHCPESSMLPDDSCGLLTANGCTDEPSSFTASSSLVVEQHPCQHSDAAPQITLSAELAVSDDFESSSAGSFVMVNAPSPPVGETATSKFVAPADGSGDAASFPGGSITPQEQQLPVSVASTTDKYAALTEPLPQLSVDRSDEQPATAEKEDMDILGNGKLIKKVLKSGSGLHTRPQYGSQVSIRCQGILPDGTVVDKSEGLSFILHDGDVIAALDLAVALMQLGEVCELRAAPDYAYKGIGRHPDVPPDTAITYTVELLAVSGPPIISELPIEQVISLADKKRDRGNYLYSRTEYDSAVICYSRAVQIADDPGIQSEDPSKLQELLELRLKCYNNLAATQVKAKQYDAAVESCNKVLSIQPDNVKALFRKGKSLGATGLTKEAIEILKRALQLEPSTKVIHRELFKLQEKFKKDAENEKVLCMKMFGKKGTAAVDPPKGNQHRSKVVSYGVVGAVAAVALSIGVFMLRKYL